MNKVNKNPYYQSLTPLIIPSNLKIPTKWEEIFPKKAPLEVEIGFGNGAVLVRKSLENTDKNYLGIELAWSSLKRALRRISKSKTENAKVMQLEAGKALKYYFSPESISNLYSFFPVPWPKEKHANKRLFQKEFLDLAANRLLCCGQFQIVTDCENLADWILEESKESALSFTLDFQEGYTVGSKYEAKWLAGGQKEFFCLWGHKKYHPPVEEFKDCFMEAYYFDNFNPKKFIPKDQSGEITIKFREFIFDEEQKEGLLRTIIIEDNTVQDCFLRFLYQEKEARWKLVAAQPALLLPTYGLQLALKKVIQSVKESL